MIDAQQKEHVRDPLTPYFQYYISYKYNIKGFSNNGY